MKDPKVLDTALFSSKMKAIYQNLGIKYPKFFKMDDVCKLAFLSTELLLQNGQQKIAINGPRTGIVLSTLHGCLRTDLKHFSNINEGTNYFPSPGTFVYTLPNIMLGELCIRHKITGENTCLLLPQKNGAILYDYVNDMFQYDECDQCITGWVDVSDNEYDGHLFLITKQDFGVDLPPFDRNFMTLDHNNNG